jgi:hypothetical protein
MCRIYLFTKYQMHNFFLSWIIIIKLKTNKSFHMSFVFLTSHKNITSAKVLYFSIIYNNT